LFVTVTHITSPRARQRHIFVMIAELCNSKVRTIATVLKKSTDNIEEAVQKSRNEKFPK
jgi:hypothetical protein